MDKKKAVLVLSDGSVFHGEGFGAVGTRAGELVFNTSMTGYQEALTDPSYAGQILTLAYPLIGNYGIDNTSFESSNVWVEGFVVKEACFSPSHRNSAKGIDEFLSEHGIPGISGLDTRAVVRRIRSFGVLPACISVYEGDADEGELLKMAREVNYSETDFVAKVTSKNVKEWGEGEKSVALIDCGTKLSIIRELNKRNVRAISVPAFTSSAEILSNDVDGIVISNGPGDPALLGDISKNISELFGKLPIFGVCLGNQLLGQAGGAKTYKLPFGHRGSNQPVIELESKRVYITSQNHGYAIDERTLPKEFEVSHRNCNDGTVEGITHKELPIFSVQYHPEASPGPRDSSYLFDKFVKCLR